MAICKVTIRRMSDNKEITIEEEIKDEYIESQPFLWLEGNWACDCNRHRFFQQAEKIDEDGNDWTGMECGHKSYRLSKLTIDNKDIDYVHELKD